jgi:hypothetical protein
MAGDKNSLTPKPTTPEATGSTRLAGKLQEVELSALLQMLALKHRSGKITITTRDGHGLLLLQEGNIIYAASNSAREALGNILVRHGLIDDATLIQGLEQQHAGTEEKRLGTMLVQMGAISQEVLENVLREQTAGIVQELLAWRDGFFTFEPLVVQGREVGVDARDLVMKEGLDADLMARSTPKPNAREQRGKSRQPTATGAPGPEGTVPAATLTSLKQVMTELRSPSFGGEITVWLLRHAAEIVRRCVLFSYSREWIRGIGQIGIDPEGEGGGQEISRVCIPANEPSIFSYVVETREGYKGEPPKNTWDEYLAIELGGLTPAEIVVVPMVVSGGVVALLYGDNLPDSRPIGPIDTLELLMLQAGLAMEKTTLEIRLRTLQQRLGSS